MISLIRGAGFFEIRAQNRFGPYTCQTRPLCCGQCSLFIILSARPGANRVVTSVFLSVREYRPDLLVAIFDIDCVPVFVSRYTQHWWAYESFFQ